MDKKTAKCKNGRLVGNPFHELARYLRVHHFGEHQYVGLAGEARETHEDQEAHAPLVTTKTRTEYAAEERPRSSESVGNDKTDFQVTLKVHQPVASHDFLGNIFRGTNVVVSERDDENCYNIGLSCGVGKTTIVKFIERDPDNVFSAAPDLQKIDDVSLDLHLAFNSFDIVQVNLAEHGRQVLHANHANTVMFRDLE